MKKLLLSKKQSGHHGFTLIEVMVAVFVIAVGLLGVASMQAVGIQEVQNTYFRTQADILARDMADKIRVNRTAAIADAYVSDGSAIAAPPNCLNSACGDAQVATYDLSEWQLALTNSNLPSALGVIQSVGPVDVNATFTSYRIRVFWDEDRDGDNGQGCDPDNDGDMSCVTLHVFM